ncbi:MAG TPA: AMP-binding protein [Clostridia bacterium]|nr:AMP-binding protein [Clostridia bacterium]
MVKDLPGTEQKSYPLTRGADVVAEPAYAGGERGAGRGEIERLQLRKINALLQTILPANSFYTHKLAGCIGLNPFNNLKEYSSAIPLTTRHEIVRDRLANPPYGTNLTFPLEKYVRCHQTSGTTTMPIRWLDTQESWSHIVDNWVQILGAAGVTSRDRFFFAFSFGPFLGFWSALEAVLRLGYFCFPGGAMTSLGRLQAILDNDITVLCCTPTYAQHLGEVAREKQLDLSKSRLRLIIVAGEAGGSIPATRARIERLFPGATVFDHHGMTEVGPVTFQCPARPGILHVLEAAYVAEVIDSKTGMAVNPGETGELVLTTLDRQGSPLLRYRTGDLVKPCPEAACACGRHELALEGGILGRSDDMMVVRGVNVYPSLIEEIVRSHPEVTEYRVEFDCRQSMIEMSLACEIAAENAESAELPERLAQSLQTALNLRIPVRLLPRGSLPRFEMKSQRWLKITE